MSIRRELELYIHIPFCVQKCNYCDFLSFASNANEREQYVQALIKQIENSKVVARGYEVTTIFIGGGTPSIIETEQLERIFAKVHGIFHITKDAEITIEMNPGTVTKEKLQSYKRMGINRLSIGLQSANETELKSLGRIHSYQDFCFTFEQARKVGFDNINIDLMSAIPGQTLGSWKNNLEKILKRQPEHISAYSLIIEEGTPFYKWYGETETSNIERKLQIPSEEEMLRIDEMTYELLAKHDYVRYEISNYAKQGYECKHNLGYWERKEYLGLGLGAASCIGNERWKNINNMESYLKRPQELEEKYTLMKREQMEEFCFLGLRKIKGISEEEFKEQFGIALCEVYEKEISKLLDEKLIKRKESKIFLTKRGLELGNYVFAKFI